MAKQTYNQQTLQALTLFGQHIRYGRKRLKMTVASLAERLGVSRSTVQMMEKGTGTVAIGTYFEAASLLDISLFQDDYMNISQQQARIEDKIALLPKHIHAQKSEVNDDF